MSKPAFTSADRQYMARALQLAERGLFTTTPNPRVGCVIVKDGIVVGEGWHERAGEPHAEVHALRAAGELARGATAYVTLEPCSHHGRTPPCADALIAAGVARVVAAMRDPNPQVAGRGMAKLAAAGIVSECGLLAEDAAELNPGFVLRMTQGRPWVRVKIAASLDGRTALANGDSQWITGPEARQDGHRWRARACAVLTGSGTVLADDPQLNVRGIDTPRQPLKVLVDGSLRLSATARLFDGAPVLVATANGNSSRADVLRARGAEILALPGEEGRVDLPALLQELGRRGLNEIHVEAGAGLNGALLAAGLVDEVLLYQAPCLLGASARPAFAGFELGLLTAAPRGEIRDLLRLGHDLRLLLRLAGRSPGVE